MQVTRRKLSKAYVDGIVKTMFAGVRLDRQDAERTPKGALPTNTPSRAGIDNKANDDPAANRGGDDPDAIETIDGIQQKLTPEEVERRKQKQRERQTGDSKDSANKGTPVGSPGTAPGAVGPMGDASNNVGYSARAECARFLRTFGADLGAKYFADGLTFEEAKQRFSRQRAKLATRKHATMLAGGPGLLRFANGLDAQVAEAAK